MSSPTGTALEKPLVQNIMSYKQFTTQQLTERWEDRRNIKNLLSKMSNCIVLNKDQQISKMTIPRDIAALMCSFPIETVCGRYGGGVKVADDYHLNDRTLNCEQAALLRKLGPQLEDHEFIVLNSILLQSAP